MIRVLTVMVLVTLSSCFSPPPARISQFAKQLPELTHANKPDSPWQVRIIGFDCRGRWSSYERAAADALSKSPPGTIGLADVQFRVRVYGPFLLNIECAEVEGYAVLPDEQGPERFQKRRPSSN